jgi:hypothetical protein
MEKACRAKHGLAREMYGILRTLEWLSRSMILVEVPGWRGATKAHTCRHVAKERRSQPGCIGRASDRLSYSSALRSVLAHKGRFRRLPYSCARRSPYFGSLAGEREMDAEGFDEAWGEL